MQLDKTPPLDIPLRFLLTGPLFGAAAGGLLLLRGAILLLAPNHPETQALVHLVVLGWLTMVMVGALYQILPVVVGQAVPWVGLGRWIHLALAAGVVALTAGLAFTSPVLLAMAMALLGSGMAAVLAQLGTALWRTPTRGPITASIRLAVGSLAATVLLGLVFALEHAVGRFPSTRQDWLVIHLVWGLAGWMGALITGVGYLVLPMFYLAPNFPTRRSWWVFGCLAALVALTPAMILMAPGMSTRIVILVFAGAAWGIFAWTIAGLLGARKRKVRDPTLRLWIGGLGLAVVALSALGIHAVVPNPRWLFAFGAAYLVGAVGSIELGMLYKIVPFLTWLHFYSRKVGKEPVPMVRNLLNPSLAAWQGALHFGATALLILAAIAPTEFIARSAGAALLISNGMAFALLLRTARSPIRRRKGVPSLSSPQL